MGMVTHDENTVTAPPKVEASTNHALVDDQGLTIREAIRGYPKALFWSLMVSTCVIMEGYDTILIPNFFAYPEFQKKFGYPTGNGDYQLSPAWQAAVGNAAGIGAFFGALANGLLVEKFGQKRVVLAALCTLTALIFIPFFATNIKVLFIGEVLLGLPWGIFATTAPAYASEILPLPLRVYMTSYTNMCFIIGQFIAAGILEGLVSRPDEWSYRIPFAVQWAWPAFLIPILCFAPESPWHLVRVGKLTQAEDSIRRLQSPGAKISVEDSLQLIVRTNHLEQELLVGTSYWDCFKGVELRRTEIACMVFAGQIFSGLLFAYNASYFFEQVGLGTNVIYKLNLGGTGLGLLGTLCAWFFLMPYFGRRTIYVWGSAGMTVVLFLIGFLNIDTKKTSIGMTQAVLTLVWTFMFQLSVGQLGWALPAEIGSTRLRQKTVVVARNAYYVTSVIGSVLNPYFMNPQAWNLVSHLQNC